MSDGPYGCYKTEQGLWVRDKGEERVREQQKEWQGMANTFKDVPDQIKVWDLGAHVGWFTWFANSTFKPKEILCVECSPKQVELLKYNLPENARLLNGAIVPDTFSGSTVNVFLGKTYSSCDSILPVSGRKMFYGIKAIKIADVIKEMPDPDAIKLDIEGSEYSINWIKYMPSSVKCLVAELHHNRPGQDKQLKQFHDDMVTLGFIAMRDVKLNNYTKVCHVWYNRL